MSAVTGTLMDATSSRRSARAITAQRTIVITIEINPRLKRLTVTSAIPAPIAVPTICPNPSRTDLCRLIRIVREQTIAATTPPFLRSEPPTSHAVAAAIAATEIWRSQFRRSKNGLSAFLKIRFIVEFSHL